MNPIPAGLEIRPDLAGWRVFPFWKNGLVLENPISCCPDFPDCEQEAKLAIISYGPGRGPRLIQFTKRRMRTFITVPSARNVNKTEDPP
jgi:hypothetical protein